MYMFWGYTMGTESQKGDLFKNNNNFQIQLRCVRMCFCRFISVLVWFNVFAHVDLYLDLLTLISNNQVEGGWILDGQKRWIGNSTFADVLVIFARNTSTNQING